MEKKNQQLQQENTILREKNKQLLPHNKRGIIREKLKVIKNELVINQQLISEIPELIYTGDQNDYVDEDDIKTLYEQNKLQYKFNTSQTECLANIRTKLKLSNYSNSFLDEIIIGCKINYINYINKEKVKSKKQILVELDSESDNDEI
jgi:hypothetical protein